MTTADEEKPNVTPSTPASTTISTSTSTPRTAKSSTAKDHGPQITKLRDANAKYKSLLKMAKERIQTQEDELEQLRMELKDQKTRLDHQTKEMEAQKQQMALGNEQSQGPQSYPSTNSLSSLSNFTSDQIVRVCQRIQQQQLTNGTSSSNNNSHEQHHHTSNKTEIWALFEITNVPPTEMVVGDLPLPKYKQWKSFDSENALQDFIRRDTGEPLVLPSYSLSPDQSQHMEHDAAQKVSQITEEFRRFRVRTEIQRKQSESTVRELQSNLAATATKRIEGQDVEKELHQAKIDHDLLERMKSQMEDQEEKWKSAYTIVVNENKALKSSGSEALLAAQWRQRYETLLKDKEDLETKLEMETEKAEEWNDHHRKIDAGKYEQKYRDLKESFRMYRKKAKEIFETQQRGGDVGLLTVSSMNADSSKSDAKLSYLKNLMVNYLSSDDAVREQMEGAIATVLKFTPQEIQRIEQKKEEYGYSSTANEYLSSFLEYTMAATTTTTEADGTTGVATAAGGGTTTGIQ